MRSLLYYLGMVLLIAAAASGVAEILFYLTNDAHDGLGLGTMWYRVNANSLVGFQAGIEKGLGSTVGPAVWMPIAFVLRLPAWLVFGVLGVLFMLLGRERQRFSTF